MDETERNIIHKNINNTNKGNELNAFGKDILFLIVFTLLLNFLASFNDFS